MIPDYTDYDLEQLRQVLRTIDAERFPERASEVRERIAALEQARSAPETAETAPQPEQGTLRSVGKVLAAVGAVDAVVAVATYLLHPENGFYMSVAMWLGAVMVWSGNLRAVSMVRWVACAYLPIALLWAVALFFPPLDLSLSYLRLYPLQLLMLAGVQVCHWVVALWLVRTLGMPPILAARLAAGKPVRDMRIPFALGSLGVLFSIFLMTKLLGSERAHRAEALAQQSVGKGYRVYTESLNIATTAALGSGESATHVTASVAAWNDSVVIHVPVHWREN